MTNIRDVTKSEFLSLYLSEFLEHIIVVDGNIYAKSWKGRKDTAEVIRYVTP